jgi:hypothetical protein
LEAAYRSLQAQAATIDDPTMRHSLLESVAAHHEVIAAWAQRETRQ